MNTNFHLVPAEWVACLAFARLELTGEKHKFLFQPPSITSGGKLSSYQNKMFPSSSSHTYELCALIKPWIRLETELDHVQTISSGSSNINSTDVMSTDLPVPSPSPFELVLVVSTGKSEPHPHAPLTRGRKPLRVHSCQHCASLSGPRKELPGSRWK